VGHAPSLCHVQGWSIRTACTSAPSAIVDVKKAMALLPAIVSRPM
jgi:hypothetical protein